MAAITLGSNTWTLVALPENVGFADISLSMTDGVAIASSPYDPSQTQAQAWPGADYWRMQATLPKMTEYTAGYWKAFLGALRGRLNVFQVGDVNRPNPLGRAEGAPVVDGTIGGGNAVGAYSLNTKGWTPNIYRQLIPGDYLQIGYRLHMAVAEVDSSSAGKAAIQIFPSLRETPADGATISLVNTVGIFRLLQNERGWHTTVDRLTNLSLAAMEQK